MTDEGAKPTLDPRTRSILRVVADLGYSVQVGQGQITATHHRTGERFIVLEEDPHAAAVQLAVRFGIDFMDG